MPLLRVRPLVLLTTFSTLCILGVAPLAQRSGVDPVATSGRVPLTVERHQAGAPVTLGVPFPKGALASPDHVRLLGPDGREHPSQVTEVTTWEPIDPSVKWVWVFFFTDAGPAYTLEYGPTVRRQAAPTRLEFINNPRAQGLAEITTGPLRFVVRQGDTGFLSSVQLDLAGDGFTDADVIASGPAGRGSFADLLDDAGVDSSRAVILRTFIDKGTGPLHAILRVEGEYRYGRGDNRASPFVTRIHAYAGKSYIRVLHTWVYSGTPDKHRPQAGDYPHVATQTQNLITTDPTDTGWTMPNDRLQGLGLTLSLPLASDAQARFGLRDGSWWAPGSRRVISVPPGAVGPATVVQRGPKPDRIPPVPESSATTRLAGSAGFEANVTSGERSIGRAERAEGWVDVFDGTRGVAIGLKHFVEEYPKALTFDPAAGTLSAFFWASQAGPMSFARASNAPANENAVENWAQGIAKTSEALLFFHGSQTTAAEVASTMQLVLEPPVAHVAPAWYGKSEVYGRMAPHGNGQADLEHSLDYKFAWMRFNQTWEPWFGMFEYGDMMNTFDGQRWSVFGNGEPAQDFMWWLQFMRTGNAGIFDTAMAFSRHTMDVDNTHWPVGPQYLGDTNFPLDYWSTLGAPPAGKYLGVGRRHADQHWMHILSAHVWVQGWMASYYLAGEQRGLDVARLTADMHLRRLWGEHELTGRRLYLSIWNLAEVWDATKDVRYKRELDDRVARMLALQRDQADSLVLERYGYTNIYASHGLAKYLSMTGDAAVRAALVRHARAVRDMPPLNHFMESYLSSIHSLVLGYQLTGDQSFVVEMKRRLDPLRVDTLPRPIDDGWTQADLFKALEAADHFPEDPNRFRPNASNLGTTAPPTRRPIWSFTNGLRVFGWTTAFTVPWAIEVLNSIEDRGLRIEDRN